MVARMWPWPPPARKFRVRLVVRRAEGLTATATATASSSPVAEAKVAVEVRWKGPKASPLGSLRRVMHSNRTRLESAAEAAVAWEEEFERVETFTATSHRKSGAAFHPWDLAFSVFVNVSHRLFFSLFSSFLVLPP
jgi:hypothetical protein